jgi:hypothetical protein
MAIVSFAVPTCLIKPILTSSFKSRLILCSLSSTVLYLVVFLVESSLKWFMNSGLTSSSHLVRFHNLNDSLSPSLCLPLIQYRRMS